MAFSILPTRAQPLAVGAPAPDVTALDQDGREVHFADFYARGPVLVYFYPKAGTPGCTSQACSLRDAMAELAQKGLTILGVSSDSPDAQKRFQEKHRLPFTLIADTRGEVAKAFGVPRILGLPARQSFLIHKGKVVWVTTNAKTSEHAQEVEEALAKLTG